MRWHGQEIVNIERAFLDTNGVAQHAKAKVAKIKGTSAWDKLPSAVQRTKKLEQAWLANLRRLNVCSEKACGTF